MLFRSLTGDRNVNDGALWLHSDTGATKSPTASRVISVKEAIRTSLPGGLNLETAEPGQIRDASLRVFDRTFAVTYGLEAVAVVIGLFGLSSPMPGRLRKNVICIPRSSPWPDLSRPVRYHHSVRYAGWLPWSRGNASGRPGRTGG